MAPQFNEVIKDENALREIFGHPSKMNVNKEIPILDEHCRAFIARSPYMLLASSDADGNLDISPKGDPPGFVHILDDRTLAIPDRVGNKRIDTLTNLVQNNRVGMIFLIPGFRETLRVRGRAMIVRDLWLREQLAVKGKVPHVAIVVKVQKAFMHCAKSTLRSNIWNPDHWPNSTDLPGLSRVLNDHANLVCDIGELEELQEAIEKTYKVGLY